MAYVPDPADVTMPTDAQPAESAQAEFRALKAYLATLAGLGGGMNLFRKNVIIGGDFNTNPWQRGVSFVSPAVNTYLADRWAATFGGVATYTFRKEAGPGDTGSGYVANCLEVEVTGASGALGAGDHAALYQKIEGYNFAQIARRTAVVSFWHKHSVAGQYYVGATNNAKTKGFISAAYQQTVADTWEFSSVILEATPDAGVWEYTNSTGLQLFFAFAAGANYQGIPGSWVDLAAQVKFAGADQLNLAAAVGNKFRIAHVQLEAGNAASPFEWLPFSSVIQLCQRYYYKTYELQTPPGSATSTGAIYFGTINGGTARARVQFPVTLRAAPVITTYSTPGVPGIFDGTTSTIVLMNSMTSVALECSNGGSLDVRPVGHVVADAELY